jgi:hypothetical protein
MGTTLTGTAVKDTYDSLIKVTDNGPLSGTAKYLSDGLGNDSVLALSNARVGVGTNAPSMPLTVQRSGTGDMQDWKNGTVTSFLYQDTSKAEFGTLSNHPFVFLTNATERMRITTAGNVGIGTNAPAAKLQTTGTDAASVITGIALENFIATNPSSGNGVAVDFRLNNSGNTSAVTGKISTVNTFFRSNADMVFSTFTSDTLTEKVRIQSGGGISFNGDTAAANALDDYEEGTWTPAVIGATGTATYTTREGYYTKIGRQVTVTWFVSFQKNTISGGVQMSGLPFTVANLGNQYPQAIIMLDNLASTYDNPLLQLGNNSTISDIIVGNGSTGNHAAMQDTQLGAGTMAFRGTATYFV